MQPGAALAETQRFITAALHLTHHEDPERQYQHKGDGVDQDIHPAASGLLVVVDVHALLQHGVVQILMIGRDDGAEFLVVLFVCAVQVVACNRHSLDLAGVNVVHQSRVGECDVLARLGVVDHRPEQHHHHDDDHPENRGLDIGIIHAFSLLWRRNNALSYWTLSESNRFRLSTTARTRGVAGPATNSAAAPNPFAHTI